MSNGITSHVTMYWLNSVGTPTVKRCHTSFGHEGFQYRERFAVKAFGNSLEIDQLTMRAQDSPFFPQKKVVAAENLKEPAHLPYDISKNSGKFWIYGMDHKMDPKTVICRFMLTSRTSFFHSPILEQILALLEHSCDVSRFGNTFL